VTVRFLLDTSVCANVLKRLDDRVMRKLAALSVAEVGISAVTHSELLFGAIVSRRDEADRAAVDLFLRHVAVLPYSVEAGEHYAAIRYGVMLREATLEEHVMLVAAHARCLGLTVISCDGKGYGMVPGLVVEDWGR
jgi:tRNA(fMet)-specific endonuclease VapC